MLMIRLQRVGRRHDPSYRIVVTEKASGPQAGRYIEMLGSYDARRDAKTNKQANITLNTERIKHWLSVGAQASGTVHNLLVREGIVAGKKRDVRPAKVVIAKVEAPKEVAKEETKEVASEAQVEEVKEAEVAEETVETPVA